MVEEQHLSERRACHLVGRLRDCHRHPPSMETTTQALSARMGFTEYYYEF